MTMTRHAAKKSKGLSIIDFLRPHWKALTLALLAVAGEAATDLLEPWPLKIVLDYLLQSKQPPGWMSVMVGWIGQNKLLTAAGYDQDRSFMLVEIAGDELYFRTISRTGLTVDSGVIRRVAKSTGAEF